MSYGKFLDEVGHYYQERKKNNLPDQDWELNRNYVRDKWIEQKRYSELIAFIHENWDSGQWDEFFEPLEKNLIENKLEKEFIKFWKGILRHRFSSLWDWNKEVGRKTEYWDGSKKTFECQKLTLEGLYRFKKGLVGLGVEEEIRKTDELIKTVDKLEKSKLIEKSQKINLNSLKIYQINWRSLSQLKLNVLKELS